MQQFFIFVHTADKRSWSSGDVSVKVRFYKTPVVYSKIAAFRRWKWVLCFTPQPPYPLGKSLLYPTKKETGWASKSDRTLLRRKQSMVLVGSRATDCRSLFPYLSHYTGWASRFVILYSCSETRKEFRGCWGWWHSRIPPPVCCYSPHVNQPKARIACGIYNEVMTSNIFVNRIARWGIRDSAGSEYKELDCLECDGLLLP